MTRVAYGVQVFADEVKALRKSAKYEHGEPDGLGVVRSLTFDKATSKWLEPILDRFGDARIIGYSTEKERLTVEFSHQSRHADRRDPYPLEAAQVFVENDQ